MPLDVDWSSAATFAAWDAELMRRLFEGTLDNIRIVTNATQESTARSDQLVVSGSSVTGQSDNSPVGSPNNENEGAQMPYEAVQLSTPTEVRSQVFDYLNLRDTLMNTLDLDNWAQALQTMREQIQPVLISVQRGGFRLDSRVVAEHSLLGSVRVEYLTLEELDRVIEIASNGKMVVHRLPAPGAALDSDPVYYKLVPINAIDAAAFDSYLGGAQRLVINHDTANSIQRAWLADVRNGMQNYLDYRVNRSTYIRRVIQNRMQESVSPAVVPVPVSSEQTQKRNLSLFNFIETVKKGTNTTEKPFSKIEMLPHKTLSSRRWGIEIEAVDIYDIETPLHWALHGDGSLRTESNFEHGYDEEVTHQDDCLYYDTDDTDDCNCDPVPASPTSRNSGGNRPQQTGEWNSPILHSFHSRGLKYLCDSLEGRYSNSSAGVHVHVEATDLTPQQAVNLSMIYTALEPLFESEYHRTERNYCKSVDLSEMVSRLNTAKTIKGKAVTTFSSSRRYYTVNLAALATHGTIEFRAMGPVYEYEHLTRWAMFCREMVNIAKANVPQKAWAKVKTFDDLIVLFSKYGKETPTPVWAEDGKVDFDPIVAALGTENRRMPNARPSNAYSRMGGDAPVELFDDYVGSVAVTNGVAAQRTLNSW